jgi:replication initiation protein RepC
MDSECVTTPFGRRAMSLGMLVHQQQTKTIKPGTTRNKWKLFRSICETRASLGVSDRALTVLDALLTFYPHDDLSTECSLIVFPSNAQLSIRARGMTPATLRRHLASLVEAGLILRKDSPNGKRYARRDSAGAVNEAFGFSLAPLLARASEIEMNASAVIAERDLVKITRERLSLCRRDVTKLIEAAQQAGLPGDWSMAYTAFRAVVDEIPRNPDSDMLQRVLTRLLRVRDGIVNQLKEMTKVQGMSANGSHNERHIQDSYPDSLYELETATEEKKGSASNGNDPTATVTDSTITDRSDVENRSPRTFPLDTVLRACPQISDYAQGGTIRGWRDLMTAAIVVRTMLGVTPSAYQQACAVMGAENAASVMACILERGGHIKSAGGYLRDLSRRAAIGEFALGPMLMALVRSNVGEKFPAN